MTEAELKNKLDELLALPAETECVEFKEAKHSFDTKDLGKYFSALSNEANLKNQDCGWLIFGVNDKHEIVGSSFRNNKKDLDNLKLEIADKINNRITFIEIHELYLPQGRVIMFQIPSAPKGIPTSYGGFCFGRDGRSVGALNIQEFEQIRSQIKFDWSAQICKGATINDLDPQAIQQARENYKNKFPAKAAEVNVWDDITFLNKAKITIQGEITRTAILLLGSEEAEHFISPSVAKISWILKNEHNKEIDYEHFSCPFLLNSDKVYHKIRNLKYRYLPDNTLFPTEITKYEPYVIREALHNCIAHQDYELNGRVSVVEFPDELIFANVGNFIPKSIEKVIEQDAPPEHYRNHFLATAMFNLNMIDTIGGGIKNMFKIQRDRYFPLPDYDLSEPDKVKVKITGKVIDENYTKLLIHKTDLDLKTVILLDRVQKKFHLQDLQDNEIKTLQSLKLIEGRKPNYFVSEKIAAVTGDKSSYIKNRAFHDEHYKKMLTEYLKKYKQANRKDIDDLLLTQLSSILTNKQKDNKIKNMLRAMSQKEKTIKNTGSRRYPVWVLVL